MRYKFFIRMDMMDMMDRINEDLIGECLPPKITSLSTRQPLLCENLTRKIIGISYEVMNELGAELIINFGQAKVQTARLQHPKFINSHLDLSCPSCPSC